MTKFSWMIKSCGVFLLWAAAAVALHAQTFTSLYSFDGTDGGYVQGVLVQGTDGNVYGTTGVGGAIGYGTVFKITPSGALTILNGFEEGGGIAPAAGLTLGTDGNFYGTAYFGGAHSDGTVFKVTPNGTLTTLHNFDGRDGAAPAGELAQGTDGNFYGTTSGGGSTGHGTVFKITPSGTLTTLYSFEISSGAYPRGVFVQGTDGNFYGTTEMGGTNGYLGTVFKITPSGALTTLYSFNGTDGACPWGGVVQGTDGNFYGTTLNGGANGAGTAFKLTLSGALTTLYNFCSEANCTDGSLLFAGLIQATDGNLYGAAFDGGANEYGTIFELTTGGTLTTLHSFDGTDGRGPYAGLLQGTNGEFYGTTMDGGTNGYGQYSSGTVFSLNVGLSQFIETLPTSGKVGAHIKILGSFLTGATSVTFNGTAATFTIISKSEILTTVPTGATTGTVQVISPRLGTLSSNVPFTVTP